ncbi:hypothetical protein KY284_032961 [Solanum tuberosum]|nr:hypothetical protein KY284_032961 [Solanum tuberosum]
MRQMLGKEGTPEYSSNLAELFTSLKSLQDDCKVQVPIGDKSQINSEEETLVMGDQAIHNVLSNGKVMGIGREREALYILKDCIPSTVNTSDSISTKITSSAEDTLWHYSLGNPSGVAMHHIKSLPKKIHPHVHDQCDIFLLAKQHRLKFPAHSTKAIASFDLVHLDVWGPIRSLHMT